MPRLQFKLGQDGVAKRLGGNAGAIRDEKYGSVGHVVRKKSGFSILQEQAAVRAGVRPTMVQIYRIAAHSAAPFPDAQPCAVPNNHNKSSTLALG
jgi:hypothetical protein